MKNCLKKLVAVTLVISTFVSTVAFANPSEPTVNAQSAILMEPETGTIIYEKNSEDKMYPASMTKMLTALVLLDYFDYDALITVGDEINGITLDSSKAGHKRGETLSVENLIRGLIIPSGNDSANVVAAAVAKKIENNNDLPYEECEKIFTELMNKKAEELGCKNSHFSNAHGYHDDNHYTTAYDLSVIAKEAMKNDTFRQIVSTASYTLPSSNKYSRIDRTLITTNDLIKKQSKNYYENAIGIKTGFTTPAGNCLVSSATKDDKNLIAVVLKSRTDNDRYNDVKTLFNYGFDNFSKKDIVKTGDIVKTIDVKNATSATKNLNLVAETGVNTIVTNDKLNDTIEPQITLNEQLQAPIKKDTIVGTATYTIDNIQYTINLKAGNDVKKSYVLYIVIAIAIIALILILFEKPNKNKKQKSKRKKSAVRPTGYYKAR